MTNLTPAQLEEFESTFRYFDKDETNTLHLAEMIAALASLGIVYSEEDMDLIYDQLVEEYGAVTFEAFINLLVCFFFALLLGGLSVDLFSALFSLFKVEIMEDQTSPDQLREAFRGIAKNKVCVVVSSFLLPFSLTNLTVLQPHSPSSRSWICASHIFRQHRSITCARRCRQWVRVRRIMGAVPPVMGRKVWRRRRNSIMRGLLMRFFSRSTLFRFTFTSIVHRT